MNKGYIFATVSLIVVAAGFTGWILAQKTPVQITQTKVFAGGGNNCELENICGDGQITGTEFCDNGGICTGSSNAAFEGRHCFDIDPTGYNIWGVQRCVATGGRCIPQNGDGCSSDCSEKCYTNNVPCMIDADCGTCGAVCSSGVCAGAAVCGNWILEGTEECDDGNTTGGDGCSGACTNEGTCPSCSPCAVSGVNWTYSISGLSDNVPGSTKCVDENGDHTLVHYHMWSTCPPACTNCWSGGGASNTTKLEWSSGNDRWELTAPYQLYTYPSATWECNAQNEMAIEGTPNPDCSGWPATIIVTPVGAVECLP